MDTKKKALDLIELKIKEMSITDSIEKLENMGDKVLIESNFLYKIDMITNNERIALGEKMLNAYLDNELRLRGEEK